MRISKERARENRDRVLETASRLFRERGFEGVGVADLMKAAGFTHGGFYNHFETKEALAAEALDRAWSDMAIQRSAAPDLARLLDAYLSPANRDAPGASCPAAALAGDVSRQAESVRAAFAEGLEAMIESVRALLPGEASGARTDAAGVVAAMVGGLMLSRAVPEASPLADELLAGALHAARRAAELTRRPTPKA